MSTELAQSGGVPAIFNFFDNNQFATMQKVSEMFANSELVPDMYRVSEKVSLQKAQANCMIALSLAQRMNADALMVMQNLVIIHGRPTWSSKFLIATVNTCGRFEPLKYRATKMGMCGEVPIRTYIDALVPGSSKKEKREVITPFDGSKIENVVMVAYTKDRATGEELIGSEVSIIMAIQEGWYTKSGSKWVTMPEKMLKYRAASFWTNEYAPEISMGMKTDDEAEDITEDVEYTELSSKRPSVAQTVAESANKTVFTMDNTESETEPKPPVTPENKQDKTEKKVTKAEEKKIVTPAEDKKIDTLAQVGQELAAKAAQAENAQVNNAKAAEQAETPKTEETPAADAGVKPAFGQGLFNQ